MFKKDLLHLKQFLLREKMPIVLGAVLFASIVSVKIADNEIVALYVDDEQIKQYADVHDDIVSRSVATENESNASEFITIVANNVDIVKSGVIDEDTLIENDNERLAEEARIAEEQRLAEEERQRQLAIEQAWQNEVAYCNNCSENVPNYIEGCSSDKKTYMGYRAVTDTSSAQYKLLNSEECYTDENGLRKIGERYCIAVGSGYCKTIGTKIDLVLEDGTIVKCILGDAKSDRHTDEATHTYHVGGYENGVYYEGDGSVAEFIVDSNVFRSHNSGSVSWIDGLGGKIIKVVVLPDDMTLAEDL